MIACSIELYVKWEHEQASLFHKIVKINGALTPNEISANIHIYEWSATGSSEVEFCGKNYWLEHGVDWTPWFLLNEVAMSKVCPRLYILAICVFHLHFYQISQKLHTMPTTNRRNDKLLWDVEAALIQPIYYLAYVRCQPVNRPRPGRFYHC